MEPREIAVAFTANSRTAARRIQRETKIVVLCNGKGKVIERLSLFEWPSVNVVPNLPPVSASARKAAKKK